jgi:hypothetical protein
MSERMSDITPDLKFRFRMGLIHWQVGCQCRLVVRDFKLGSWSPVEPVSLDLQESSRDFRIEPVILAFIIPFLKRCMVLQSRQWLWRGANATADSLVAARVRVQWRSQYQNLQQRPLRSASAACLLRSPDRCFCEHCGGWLRSA